ncbi:cation-translocating P-type ATPase [Meiothermus granaticius]|uniref:Calcium-transporting ATPase 1 n=1 Tax=Meiothermus granaticius NBRC 107808 TaxID=1227551 RepID=A0A399F8J9_9DEIN|nr:cation-transporting P-type ATPase [Meiothermus granaticius]RIH91589.1 Calcium-transporting ATPase 1 [Meiothermus granaticius NBRC 107808]GEM85426.1 haloacid dehalogenase [Meiothermus granaticius NBRC 107808]
MTPWLRGLSQAEAEQKLARHGPNRLPEPPPEALWRKGLRQFQSPLIYILLVALVVDLALWGFEGGHGVPFESVAIGIILLFNAGLGVWQENKSETALRKLKQLATPLVWTERDGRWQQIPSDLLVPGDLLRLEAGDRVPADVVLLEGSSAVDESVLTGESLPVEKVPGDELYSGTLLVRNRIFAQVVRTGEHSALGRLAVMLGEVQADLTPLERRLRRFGHQIAQVVLGVAFLMALGGVLFEGWHRLDEVLLFAVALAVAAVPEGLPAVLTLTLSLGVERMAGRKAVVRRLAAVEALGSVTVIATDKTGTLTENRMEVQALDSPDLPAAYRVCALANDADHQAGDPMDLALLSYLRSKGLDPEELRAWFPRRTERPFDSQHRFMRVTVDQEGQTTSYLKGAPEVLLARSSLSRAELESWQEKVAAYAAEGYRVLGLAWGRGEREEGLHFAGLALFWDPPRLEVPGAIREAQAAGIRVLMVTGDHPATALAIAHQVGIPGERVLTGEDLEDFAPEALQVALAEVNVFARMRPEHKLRLVEALKARGEIVAMTGDGVNDAPALKRSDVGVAMGQRGSDVSREVADLVLLDDNFATIVAAVEEGRSIYENIQKFVRFLFSTNVALVLLVLLGLLAAVVLGLRDAAGAFFVPLTAVQLLWINILADGPPALALGVDRNPGVMRQQPRSPSAPLLDGPSLAFILITGAVKALLGAALLVFLFLQGVGLETVRSGVFLYESLAQLIFAYPSRSLRLLPLPNRWLDLSIWGAVGLMVLIFVLPQGRVLLGLAPLGLEPTLWILAATSLTWATAALTARWLRQHSA